MDDDKGDNENNNNFKTTHKIAKGKKNRDGNTEMYREMKKK